MKYCVIIPAYNEEKNIPSVIRGVMEHCQDIVVIDDGSSDFTGGVARDEGAMVLAHPKNMGYFEALKTGYRYASEMKYDGIVQIDADGQHDAAGIPALLDKGRSWDAVIGSRFLGPERYPTPPVKSIGIRIFRHLIHRETGLSITDPTSGFRFYNRRTFSFVSRLKCNYPDANLIIMLHRHGTTIREIPVTMQPNAQGKSMHKGKTLKYIREVFKSISQEMNRCRI